MMTLCNDRQCRNDAVLLAKSEENAGGKGAIDFCYIYAIPVAIDRYGESLGEERAASCSSSIESEPRDYATSCNVRRRAPIIRM